LIGKAPARKTEELRMKPSTAPLLVLGLVSLALLSCSGGNEEKEKRANVEREYKALVKGYGDAEKDWALDKGNPGKQKRLREAVGTLRQYVSDHRAELKEIGAGVEMTADLLDATLNALDRANAVSPDQGEE
jgi:hypothetical protein